ncbi:MAG: SLC45 family MFS transporter [Erysipelothrix sp.]|nr:SLC45 family MFS transporter [Erysipelothrix sp.]
MRKGLYSRLFSLFFVTWAVYSIVFSQVIPFLHSVGYNESQISWMLTASALIGMMTQLLIGYWLDKYQKPKSFL